MAQQPGSAPLAVSSIAVTAVNDPQVSATMTSSSAQAAAQQGTAISSISQLKAQLQAVVQQLDLTPSICRRTEDAYLQQAVKGVMDWSNVKKAKAHGKSYLLGTSRDHAGSPSDGYAGRNKSKFAKSGGGSGRTYTSRFRGVHQTFPTRRWEAQFRRNGKPTSLGCFDKEDEAARAYDKMMLWCEIHAAGGVKSGVTNFDIAEYEKEITWLNNITQDELIEHLRCEGRRQANHRGGNPPVKKQKAAGDADDSDGAIAAALAAAAEATTGAAAGAANDPAGIGGLGMLQTAMSGAVPEAAGVTAGAAADAETLQLPVQQAGSDATAAAGTAGDDGGNDIRVSAALMGISQEAMAAIQQLQQQLDQAAANGGVADPQAAAAAAFQIGRIAGSNLLAAVADPAAAAAAAETAIAQAAAAAAQTVTPRAAARLLGGSAAGSSNCLSAVAGSKAEEEGNTAAFDAVETVQQGRAGTDMLPPVPILQLPPFAQPKQEQQLQAADAGTDAAAVVEFQGDPAADLAEPMQH